MAPPVPAPLESWLVRLPLSSSEVTEAVMLPTAMAPPSAVSTVLPSVTAVPELTVKDASSWPALAPTAPVTPTVPVESILIPSLAPVSSMAAPKVTEEEPFTETSEPPASRSTSSLKVIEPMVLE